MLIRDTGVKRFTAELDQGNERLDDENVLRLLASVGDRHGSSGARTLTELTRAGITRREQLELARAGLSDNEKNDLATILDQSGYDMSPAAKNFLEALTGRSELVDARGPLTIVGDQHKGIAGIARPGETVEAINCSTAPTGKRHLDDTMVVGTADEYGRFLGTLPDVREGDIIRLRARAADGSTSDWLTITARGIEAADTREAQLNLERLDLAASAGGTVSVTHNTALPFAEPNAKLRFTNILTGENFDVQATENGAPPPGLQLRGKAGDSFNVAASDGRTNTDFRNAAGTLQVPGSPEDDLALLRAPGEGPLPAQLVQEIAEKLRPKLSKMGDLPYYADEWESFFKDALRRHDLKADDVTLEYLVKRFEIPTKISFGVVTALFEDEPRPSVHQAFERAVESFRTRGFVPSRADKEALFQSLKGTFVAWHVHEGVWRFNDEFDRDPDHASEWRPIFEDALQSNGLRIDQAAVESLRREYEIPTVVENAITQWSDHGLRAPRASFDLLMKDRDFGLLARDRTELFNELRPVLKAKLDRARNFQDMLEEREREDREIRAWLRDRGDHPGPDVSSEDLRLRYLETLRHERLDAAVGRLVASGMFDPPRGGGSQPSQMVPGPIAAAPTPSGPQVVDIPRMNVVYGRSSIDPWIARVDREFNARLSKPR